MAAVQDDFAMSLSLALRLVTSTAAVSAISSAPTNPATVCATCHPKETALFMESAMGKSLIVPGPMSPGHATHEPSGSTIAIEERNRQLMQSLSEHGQTFTTFVLNGRANTDVIAVSHAEQLAKSKCALESCGKFWCATLPQSAW